MKWTSYTKIRNGEKVHPEEYRKDCIDSVKDCLFAFYKHRSEEGVGCEIMLKIAEGYIKEARRPEVEIRKIIKGIPKKEGKLLTFL